MKKCILLLSLLIFVMLLSSCTLTPSRIAKCWDGEWSGSCCITEANGAWIDNLDTTLPCTLTLTVAQDGTASCYTSITGFGPVFTFQVDAISDKEIMLSGSCRPSADERYSAAINNLKAIRGDKHSLSISGTYNDPTADCGFTFEFNLSRTAEK